MFVDIWKNLPKPFFVLAPMDDVTDTVFRRVVSECAPPDLFFTEFVNVDALQSQGRKATLRRLKFTKHERPIIAQIWGKTPENYYKTAVELTELGFDGIDINMGCPIKNVVNNGCCTALINNRELAKELIEATQEGAREGALRKQEREVVQSPATLPVSVKTRTGFNEADMSWPEFLLGLKLNALTIHGRTRKQMSKVPADWDIIGKIREMRDELSPATKIVGNGDVMSRAQGEELADKYSLDGIMIGRGVFHDPFVFANSLSSESPWESHSKEQKIALYRRHVELFIKTYYPDQFSATELTTSFHAPKIHTLNKFCKIYINNFDGAKELRDKLMHAGSADELLKMLS